MTSELIRTYIYAISLGLLIAWAGVRMAIAMGVMP